MTKENAWIGGRQDESEVWSWSDGSPWTGYENWFDSTEPNYDQNNKEDFLMINLYKTGTWNDAENDAQYADGSL